MSIIFVLVSVISSSIEYHVSLTQDVAITLVGILLLAGFGFLMFKNTKLLMKISRDEYWKKSSLILLTGINITLVLFFIVAGYIVGVLVTGFAAKGMY